MKDLFKNIILKPIKPRENRSFERDVIFNTWHKTWENFLKNDVKSPKKVYSDNFTRQDEVLSIYDIEQDKCIGLVFFKYIDFNDLTSPLDSYFSDWPQLAIEKLVSEGDKVIVCSQFTIAEEFRAQRVPFKWKDILVYLTVYYFFYYTNSDVMTGALSVSRGVNKSSYHNGGARKLAENILNEEYGLPEDLVGFFRTDINQFLGKMNFKFAEEILDNSQLLIKERNLEKEAA